MIKLTLCHLSCDFINQNKILGDMASKKRSLRQTEVTEKKADKLINIWRESEFMTLGNHFHGKEDDVLKASFNPDWRVSNMVMDGNTLSLACGGHEVESFHIHFALKESQRRKLNVMPILRITFSEKDNLSAKCLKFALPSERVKSRNFLKGVMASSSNVGSAQVPVQLLRIVTQNWMQLDPALIDDAFLANVDENNGPGGSGLMRLTGYHLSKDKNKSLFDKLLKLVQNKSLSQLCIHFGIDANKSAARAAFTFTPVIELVAKGGLEDQLKQYAKELRGTNSKTIDEMPVFVPNTRSSDEDNSWLFEYIRPCPPC